MNAWNSLKTFARTLALACVGIALVTGPGPSPLQAQFVRSQVPLPEYITHPRSRINPDTKSADITVHFSAYSVEPGATDSPVVWWYCNGNFVAEQSSTIFNKLVNTAGQPTYEFWDPYVLPSGQRTQWISPGPTARSRMTWESVYSIPAGSPSAVYRAFIPALGSYTNYVEVLTTPATLPGGTRPSLQIVKSPVDIFRDEKSSASMWGDAKYHGLGLFNFPFGATVDAEGFVYIADTDNHAIRRATPGGYLETVAGIDGEPWALIGQDIILRTLTGGTCLSVTDSLVMFDSNRGISVGDIIVPSGGVISSGSAWVAGTGYHVQEVLSDKRSIKLLQDTTHPALGRVVSGFTAQHKPDARGPRTQYYFEREPLWGPSSNLELPGAVIKPGDTLVNVADPLSLTKGSSITGYGIPAGTTIADFTNQTVTLDRAATMSVATTIFFGAGQSVPLTGSVLSSGQAIVVSNTLSTGYPAAAQLLPNMYVLSTESGGLGIANPTAITSVGTSTLVLSGTASTTIAGTAISVATSAGSVALAGVKLTQGSTTATIASPTLPSGWSAGWFLEGTGIPNNTRILDKSKGGILLSNTSSVTSQILAAGGTLLTTANLAPPIATLTGGSFVASSTAVRVASTANILPGMFVESGTAFPPATRVVSTSGTGTIYVSAAALTSGANNTISVYSTGPTITAELALGSNTASVIMTDTVAALPTTTRVYGTGIPVGTTLNSTFTSVVMSGTATATSAGTLITGYSPVVPSLTGLSLNGGTGLPLYPATVAGLSLSNIASLSPGMRVYNSSIPNGTTIAKIQTDVVLNTPTTATGVYNLAAIQQGPSKAAVLTAGVTQVRLSEGTLGLTPGMSVIGSGIPSGATIASLPMSVLLSQPVLSTAVAGGTILTSPSAGKWSQQVVPGISRNRYAGNQVTGNTNLLSYRYDSDSTNRIVFQDNEQIRAGKREPLFDSPEGVAAADDLSVYVADTGNNAIRRIYTDSSGHTVVLTLPTEYTKNQVLGKQQVVLNQPRGIFFFGSLSTPDAANPPALFVLDFTGLWRFTLDKTGSGFTDSTLIRNLNVGWQSGAQSPQPGDLAIFRNYAPRGLTVTDRGRTVYVADTVSHVIRKISLNDDYTYKNEDIVAGFVGAKGSVDGNTGFYPLAAANRYKADENVSRLSYPAGLAMDANQNLYFSEMGSHKVRRVVFDSTDSKVSAKVESLAGSGLPGPLDGSKGEGTGAGASFWYPAALAFDNTDPLNPSFILADSSNHSIRRLALSGTSTVSAGTGTTGTTGTTGLTAFMTSTHMLGVTGCVGNRDFAEVSEFNPEWKWYGEPIADEWSFAGRAKLPTWYRMNLTDLRVEDSGPIELDIGNSFGAIGITAQSQLRVTPKSPDDLPKFWQPGYKQKITSSITGQDATQLRIDTGDLDLTQSALVAPSDQVTYQWEVLNSQTLSGGTLSGGSLTAETKTDPLKLYVSDVSGIRVGDSIVEPGSWTAGKTTIQPGTRVLAITAGALNAGTLTLSKQALAGKSGVVLENWIPLTDSLTDTYQDTRVTKLLGNIGSNLYGELTSISGAQKSTLTIRRFQKNLTGLVPEVRFRCQPLSKTVLAKQRDAGDLVSPVERHDEVVTDDISWTYYPGLSSLPAAFATSSGTSAVTTSTLVLGTASISVSFTDGVATIAPPSTTSTQIDAAGNNPFLLLEGTDWISGLGGPLPGARTISGEYLPLSLGKTVANITGSTIPLDAAALGSGGVNVTGTYQTTGNFKAAGSVLTGVGGEVQTGLGSLSITGGNIRASGANLQAVGSDVSASGGIYVTNGGTFVTTGGGFTAIGGAFVFKGGTVSVMGAGLESFDQSVNILTGTLVASGGTYTQVYQPVIGGTSQILVGGTYAPYSQGAVFSGGSLSLAAGGTTLSGGSYLYGNEFGLTEGTVSTTGGEVATWGGTLTVMGGTFSSKDGQISSTGGTLTAQGGGYSYTGSVFAAVPKRVNLYRGSLSLDAGTVVLNGSISTLASVTTNGTLMAVSPVGGAVSLGGTVSTTGGTVTVSGGTVTFSGGTPAQTLLTGTVTATSGTLVITGGTLTYSDGKYTNRGGSLVALGSAIGFSGTDSWANISGGSLTIDGANFITFGGAVNNSGTLTVSGGIVTSAGGVVTSSGGTVSLGGALFGGTVSTSGTGPFIVTGGTLTTNGSLVAAAVGTGVDGPVQFTGGTVSVLAGTVSKTGGTVLATVEKGVNTGGISIVGGAVSITGGSLVGSAETLTTLGGTVNFGGSLLDGTASTATGGTVVFTAGTVAVSRGQMSIAAATQSFTSGSIWDTHSITDGSKKTDGGDLGAIGGTLILTGGTYSATSSRITVSGGDLTVAGGTVSMGGGSLSAYLGTLSVVGGDWTASGGQMNASVTVAGGSLTASGAPVTLLSGTAKIIGGTLLTTGGTVSSATTLTVEAARTSEGQWQAPKVVQTSFPPVFSANAHPAPLGELTKQSLLFEELSGSSKPVTLVLAGSLWAFPKLAGDDVLNPKVRLWHQWMMKAEDGTLKKVSEVREGGSFSFTLPSFADYEKERNDAVLGRSTKAGYYFIRAWVGESNVYEDLLGLDTKRIGGKAYFVDSERFYLGFPMAPNLRNFAILGPQSTPPVQIVELKDAYDQTADLTVSFEARGFTSDQNVGLEWQYLPWAKAYEAGMIREDRETTDPEKQNVQAWALYGRTVRALNVGDAVAPAQFLGATFSCTASVNRGTLSITKFPRLAEGDPSGLYRLKVSLPATADGPGKGPAVAAFSPVIVLGVRDIPYVLTTDADAYTITTKAQVLQAGTWTLKSESTNSPVKDDFDLNTPVAPQATMTVKVAQSAPDSLRIKADTGVVRKFIWRRDRERVYGDNIYVLSDSSLSIVPLSFSELGTYTVAVTNAVSSQEVDLSPTTAAGATGWKLGSSSAFNILGAATARTVSNGTPSVVPDGETLPAVEGVPLDGNTLRVALGQSAVLEIPVTNSPPPDIKWYKLSGTTWVSAASRLKIPVAGPPMIQSVVQADAGWYRADLVLGALTARRTLKLFVETLPDPSAPVPSLKTFSFGSPLTLSAKRSSTGALFSASADTKYFTFQWYKNGVSISGETKETLAIAALSRAHSGQYTVAVTGVAGTRTSSALSVTVNANTMQTDPLFPVTMTNVGNVSYLSSPMIALTQGGTLVKGKGNFAAGTKITLTGFATGTTLLGWNVFDTNGNATRIPARGGVFVMPASAVTISPATGRSPAGSYSGFLSIDQPWKGSDEWGMFTSKQALEGDSIRVSSNKVRGFVKCTVTSLGSVSGTVSLERKTLPFTSALTMSAAGEWMAPFQVRTTLQNGAAWILSGKLVVNGGPVFQATTLAGVENAQKVSITVDPFLSQDKMSTLVGKSAAGPGVASGATVIAVDKADNAKSATLTLSAPMAALYSNFKLLVGAEEAQMDNVVHVTLNGAILEKILPTSKNSQPLYAIAASSQAAFKALQGFITDDNPGTTAPSAPIIYTTAIHRFDPYVSSGLHTLGRGGVLSTSITAQGLAMVVGRLPNGAGGSAITCSGYIGRPFYKGSDEAFDAEGVTTFPKGSPTLQALAFEDVNQTVVPVSNIEAAGVEVMREALLRKSASVCLPLWPTTPVGDTAAEPVFGALLISGSRVDGCLGVLNQKVGAIADSEYTHNYADGWIFDPTQVAPGLPAPFSATSEFRLLTTSPEEIATGVPGTYPTAFVSLTSPSDGDFLASGSLLTSLAMKPLLIGTSSLTGGTNFAYTATGVSGMYKWSFNENTGRYSGGVFSSLSAADNLANDWCQARTQLSVSIYGVILQGNRLTVDAARTNRKNFDPYAPGIAGFLTRGSVLTGNYLVNVLGNSPQKVVTKQGTGGTSTYKTYRTEAISLIPYEPY